MSSPGVSKIIHIYNKKGAYRKKRKEKDFMRK